MKPSKELLNVLKKTREKLLHDEDSYEWQSCSQCNCGQIAQIIMDCTEADLYKIIEKSKARISALSGEKADFYDFSVWTYAVKLTQYHTSEYTEMLRAFEAIGITEEDIEEIEFINGRKAENLEDEIQPSVEEFIDWLTQKINWIEAELSLQKNVQPVEVKVRG